MHEGLETLSRFVSHAQLIAPFAPDSLDDERRRELLDTARFFPLKPGESITLRADGGHDCLRVLSGRATVTPSAGEPFELQPARSLNCPRVPSHRGGLLTVHAEEETLVCHLDQDQLDFRMAWQELSHSLEGKDAELQRRMRKIQSSLLFRRVPAESLEEAVRRMQPVEVSEGEEIIRQWQPGDTFYVIDEGRAEVWREEFPGDDAERVATLDEGDCFGEEALVTGNQRSATVRMSSAGRLLVLGKEDFTDLISHAMIREADAPVAKAMLENGYRLLDVRYEEEAEESAIPGSLLIPLHELRERADELDAEGRYVVYCRSGKRSAVAALLLSQRRFEAISLKGGILEWPYEVESSLPPPPPRPM